MRLNKLLREAQPAGRRQYGSKIAIIPTVLTSPAYGVVYHAKERQTSRVVALKQVRISAEERQNGIPITALREISILRSLKHSNIINFLDVAVGDRAMDEIYMVMEYAEQVW